MKFDEPHLIINLNDNRTIFTVISYDANKDYELIKNIIIASEGIHNGKITDVNELGDVMISQLSGLFEDKNKSH